MRSQWIRKLRTFPRPKYRSRTPNRQSGTCDTCDWLRKTIHISSASPIDNSLKVLSVCSEALLTYSSWSFPPNSKWRESGGQLWTKWKELTQREQRHKAAHLYGWAQPQHQFLQREALRQNLEVNLYTPLLSKRVRESWTFSTCQLFTALFTAHRHSLNTLYLDQRVSIFPHHSRYLHGIQAPRCITQDECTLRSPSICPSCEDPPFLFSEIKWHVILL